MKVLFKNGQILGTAELTVSSDKVGIERLELDIVSGLSLTVDVSTDRHRSLVARVTQHYQLQRKYQVRDI
jgi:Transmembrane protein family 132